MDNKKNVENEDYQFIREKLVNKKKNRIKKWLLASLGVVALALVFGVVARFAFIKSEHLVQTILGISPTPTQPEITKVPISVAPITPKPTNTPIPTPEPTDEATPTEEVTPSPTPTATPAPEPTDSEGGLLAVYEEIRRLSEESSKYLVSVDFVNLDFDWFGEEIEEITYGGGMVIGDNGVELLILVNAENLTNADRIDVTIAGTRITDVELFMCSTDYGMATIKVELTRLNNGELDRITYARFGNSDNLGIGMPLLAIGSPDGHFGAVELAFITSKAQNTYIVDNALEIYNTSLPEVEEGSGVVINMDGEVVGFITHDFKDSKTTSQARFYTINACKDVISRMVNGQNRNYLGVIAKETPANVLSVLGVSNGLYITEVQADSPAALAGLRKGDVITRFGGAELSSTFELNQLLNNYEVGDEVVLTYIHGNETQTTSVKIGERT